MTVTISSATAPDHDAADVVLLAGRAAWLPATGTLLVADLHLGKAAAFRRQGIPVPEGSAQEDLRRLAQLVRDTAARRLLVLGDLFHARSGCTERVFAEFTAARRAFADTEVMLVVGNHDHAVGRLPPALGIDSCMRSLDEPPLHFVHDAATPLPDLDHDRPCFTIAGHLHPTLSLQAPSGDRLADRCFVADDSTLVLPAFGSFTGGHRVKPEAGMRLWIARDDGVVEVTRLALATPRSAETPPAAARARRGR
jgi:DNA ligase-associated metallophosphoesterase